MGGRRSGSAADGHHNHHNHQKQQLKGRGLESMVLERLAVPEPVEQFGQFEELSRLYAIDQPFVPRSQLELQFDVYDGRKLHQSGLMEFGDGEGDADQDEYDAAAAAAAAADNYQQDDGDEARDLEQQPDEPSGYCGGGGGGGGGARTSAGDNRDQQLGDVRVQRAKLQLDPLGHRLRHQKNRALVGGSAGRRHGRGRAAGGGLSWCKMLFNRNNPGCCLMSASDTNQELGLMSCSSSNQTINQQSMPLATVNYNDELRQRRGRQRQRVASNEEAVQAALAPQPGDDDELLELKAEAFRLVGGALAGARTAQQGHELASLAAAAAAAAASNGSAGGGLPTGQQLLVDGSSMGPPGGNGMDALLASEPTDLVSVCLLDKRRLPRPASLFPATNGRRWARASAHLARLRRKLLHSAARQQLRAASATSSGGGRAPSGPTAAAAGKQADSIARKVSRRFWSSLSKEPAFKYDDNHEEFDDDHDDCCDPIGKKLIDTDKTTANKKNRSAMKLQKHELTLDKETTNELVELVKGSLNQLIDAQLLFRNKLTSSGGGQQDPISCQLLAPFRGAEYDNLLRNNFNLLKIWQNLEETKRLVCFVCEPIKANLADLFWFNRNRTEWAPAQAFESCWPSLGALASGGYNDYHSNEPHIGPTSSSTNTSTLGKCLMFVSPLVCLDASQVKRGLIQILEALNFLHVICKLVHRNLNPKNILIAANDNWKLSGLEFAVRFESTTISESASIMAQEVNTPMLRYTSSANSVSPLRRQRTLHQTKCQEFVRQPKQCRLLQPDLDYLAPEIWRHSKCSHKSDIFSFALILGQTYDLCRHKSPISCHWAAHNYETELKRLDERRKKKLSLMVPFEMRAILLEMLDCEPNLRPSANYTLQLFKRPIELCKANEDSLRHLKSSLGYLDTRLCTTANQQASTITTTTCIGFVGATTNTTGQQQQTNGLINNNASSDVQTAGKGQFVQNLSDLSHHQQHSLSAARPAPKRANYFKRVTSGPAVAHRTRQTKNLQLLNLLLRAVDSMTATATATGNDSIEQHQQQQLVRRPSTQLFQTTNTNTSSASATTAATTTSNQLANRRPTFAAIKYQFELTLETLKQVYKSTQSGAPSHPIETMAGLMGASCAPCPIDSRSLMFIVALHRRLLDQVAGMRAELPVVCRLMPAPGQLVAPSDRNYWPSASHRALADAEDRLHLLVSKQSMARLGEALADPLLKLDEFLLVFELVGELVAFVGQKCRQNFSQRGKQLLNELTPVTGCPSLSSSDEEDEEETSIAGATTATVGHHQHHQLAALAALTTSASRSNQLVNSISSNSTNLAFANSPSSNQNNSNNRMSNQHRYSDYDGHDPSFNQSLARQQQQQQQQQRPPSRQINLPTSINIVAPSPMGSMRDVSHRTSVDSNSQLQHQQQQQQQQQMMYSPLGSNTKLNQHQHQRYSISQIGSNASGQSIKQHRQQADDDYHQQISTQMAQQLNLNNNNTYQQHQSSSTSSLDNNSNNNVSNHLQDPTNPNHDDKSRSQLIDELLKTINDDSFNDLMDFNNKYTAAKSGGSGAASGRSSATGADQLSAVELANSNRPKSAIDGGPQLRPSSATGQSSSGAGQQQQQQQQQRPRTLNLNNQNNYDDSSQQQPNRTTTNTFDNVIRRMSTNFVQNFNKMSATTLAGTQSSGVTITGGGDQQQQQLEQTNSNIMNNNNNLRRERSSTNSTSNQCNSLYVDNQIPARRHSDNTINVPRIQVALSSPQASGSRLNLNQRATASASKLANKWKLNAKTNQREASDKLSPNLGGALSYMRRHSSGNTNNNGNNNNTSNNSNTSTNSNHHHNNHHHHHNNKDDQNHQSNGHHLLPNASPFKTRSSSNLGLDFLLSNRSMKRRYSAASMLGHQTQRKAEDLLDAGMKSVQNMFS